jgi:hypothetical protein
MNEGETNFCVVISFSDIWHDRGIAQFHSMDKSKHEYQKSGEEINFRLLHSGFRVQAISVL